jgi:hypothetical protein
VVLTALFAAGLASLAVFGAVPLVLTWLLGSYARAEAAGRKAQTSREENHR